MTELPSGTVTFLFTDLEDSTRLWEMHPEAMRVALARHDELLSTAIEAHHGRVVKTTGDGVHAVFASVRDAVDAAVGAQIALSAEVWETTGPLRVRTAWRRLLRSGVESGGAHHERGERRPSPVVRSHG
jgi:class 3 adenylate cyclase